MWLLALSLGSMSSFPVLLPFAFLKTVSLSLSRLCLQLRHLVRAPGLQMHRTPTTQSASTFHGCTRQIPDGHIWLPPLPFFLEPITGLCFLTWWVHFPPFALARPAASYRRLSPCLGRGLLVDSHSPLLSLPSPPSTIPNRIFSHCLFP